MTADTATPSKRGHSPLQSFTIALAAILLADLLSFGLVVGVLITQQHSQSKKDAQHTTDQFYLQCLTSKSSREGLRVMVHLAYDRQGGPLDLTHIEGYSALDRATQTWIANVAKATTPPPGSSNLSQRDQILALFKDPDCEKKFPTHTRGLHLPPEDTVPAPTTTVP